jgi:hypothetical protein
MLIRVSVFTSQVCHAPASFARIIRTAAHQRTRFVCARLDMSDMSRQRIARDIVSHRTNARIKRRYCGRVTIWVSVSCSHFAASRSCCSSSCVVRVGQRGMHE